MWCANICLSLRFQLFWILQFYLGGELVSCIIVLCLTFWGTTKPRDVILSSLPYKGKYKSCRNLLFWMRLLLWSNSNCPFGDKLVVKEELGIIVLGSSSSDFRPSLIKRDDPRWKGHWTESHHEGGEAPGWHLGLISRAWTYGEGLTSHKICQGWKPFWPDHSGKEKHHQSSTLGMDSIFSNLQKLRQVPYCLMPTRFLPVQESAKAARPSCLNPVHSKGNTVHWQAPERTPGPLEYLAE